MSCSPGHGSCHVVPGAAGPAGWLRDPVTPGPNVSVSLPAASSAAGGTGDAPGRPRAVPGQDPAHQRRVVGPLVVAGLDGVLLLAPALGQLARGASLGGVVRL